MDHRAECLWLPRIQYGSTHLGVFHLRLLVTDFAEFANGYEHYYRAGDPVHMGGYKWTLVAYSRDAGNWATSRDLRVHVQCYTFLNRWTCRAKVLLKVLSTRLGVPDVQGEFDATFTYAKSQYGLDQFAEFQVGLAMDERTMAPS